MVPPSDGRVGMGEAGEVCMDVAVMCERGLI